MQGGFVERFIAVVPTRPLKTQWTWAVAEAGLQLDPGFRGGALTHGMHGVVATYAQILEDPAVFRRLARVPTLVVCDEIHHAGDESAWGESLRQAFDDAPYRLHLSGTPFRTSRTPVTYVRYGADGVVEADYLYGYRQAIVEGVARPVVCHPHNAEVVWCDDAGEHRQQLSDAKSTIEHQRARLRAALGDDGFVTAMVRQGDELITRLRHRDPDAAGFIAAMSVKHARWIASIVRKVAGAHPVIVVAEDNDADEHLARFRGNKERWLVAVRKVSEGVDVPRLRVELYLTNSATDLLFRQLVGRIVRVDGEDREPSYVLFPADPRLLELARALEADVLGSGDSAQAPAPLPRAEAAVESSPDPIDVRDVRHFEEEPWMVGSVDPYALDLRERSPAPATREAVPLAEEFDRLRKAVAATTSEVSREFPSLTPQDVNAWWVRIERCRVDECTPEQLRKRISTMRAWIKRGRTPVAVQRR
jgi:superfamily II DNA or RNA helicase